MRKSIVFSILVIILVTSGLPADVIRVPADQPTILAGIMIKLRIESLIAETNI